MILAKTFLSSISWVGELLAMGGLLAGCLFFVSELSGIIVPYFTVGCISKNGVNLIKLPLALPMISLFALFILHRVTQLCLNMAEA